MKFNLSVYRHYSLRPVFYAHTFPEHALLLIELNPSPFAYHFFFLIPIPHCQRENYTQISTFFYQHFFLVFVLGCLFVCGILFVCFGGVFFFLTAQDTSVNGVKKDFGGMVELCSSTEKSRM